MPELILITPVWEKLLKGLDQFAASTVRAELSAALLYVRKEKRSVAITKHKNIVAIIACPRDGALLEALKKNTDILKMLEDRHPELRE